MTENLRLRRAAELSKWLVETKKQYTRKQLCEQFKWHPQTLDRILPIVDQWGMLEVDESRQPFLYSHKKGASPNFYKPFQFTDAPQTEIDLRDRCNSVTRTTKNWQFHSDFWNVDKRVQIIYALIFGSALEESDDIDQYEAFVNAVAARFRQHYIAYRLACSLQKLQRRERGPKYLDNLGIEWKRDDDESDIRLLFRDLFTKFLEENA